MIDQVNSSASGPVNDKLRDELLQLREKQLKRVQEVVADNKQDKALLRGMRTAREKNTVQFCALLKKYGWPTRNLVGEDAVNAAFSLLTNNSTFALQVELLPVVVAASKKGEIPRAGLASYIDRLRLSSGLKQLFGTQATIQNGFLVLFPIEAEAQVDARRKQFELPPLKAYLRSLESAYRLPLIKSTGALTNVYSQTARNSIDKVTSVDLLGSETKDDVEVLRIETNLVSLNVSVYSDKSRTQVSPLGQNDFAVTEDGRPEEITFFATNDMPFDLALLIDLSGSTSGKRDLIRKSTQRFIQAARPSDRLAIVTFSDGTEVISPLTEDRGKLLDSVNQIDGTGGSHVWDALKFTLDQVVGPKTLARRRAVVFMTDGADNALVSFRGGSKISFADLLEGVRHSDTMIIPIYLDTEGHDPLSRRIYENARKTLLLLADESGGLYYKARKLEDLDGVYQQVIDDLGKVYSLGYKPINDKHDGSWRAVKIEIPKHPELKTRARPGYYAN